MQTNTRRRLTRAGGATALVAGLFAGGYGIASAASGTSGTSGSASPGSTSTQAPAGMGMHGFGHHGGPGGPGGPGGLSGTVSNLTSGSFTLTRPDGSTVTVNTSGSTTYERDGASAAASALANGERVSVRPTQASTPSSGTASTAPTSVTASEVDIMDPSIRGTVQAVNGNVVTVVDGQGFYRYVNLSGTTTYTNAGNSATQSAVTVGSKVVAFGSIDSDHTSLDASTVAVNPTRPQGPHGPMMGGPQDSGSQSGTSSASGASA